MLRQEGRNIRLAPVVDHEIFALQSGQLPFVVSHPQALEAAVPHALRAINAAVGMIAHHELLILLVDRDQLDGVGGAVLHA